MLFIVNVVGLLLVVLIVKWFWFYRPIAVKAKSANPIVITVENGIYQPSQIHVQGNEPVTLEFHRLDASPCAETVIFPNLQLSQELLLNTPTRVQIPALKTGNYAFHCQMQMYRGVLSVQ